MEAIQYCGGIAAVLWGDASVHVGIASVLWRNSISTAEAVQYCGGASVLWRLFSTVEG